MGALIYTLQEETGVNSVKIMECMKLLELKLSPPPVFSSTQKNVPRLAQKTANSAMYK
jgi:hypothetical protein